VVKKEKVLMEVIPGIAPMGGARTDDPAEVAYCESLWSEDIEMSQAVLDRVVWLE
jgi:hypothetical protein